MIPLRCSQSKPVSRASRSTLEKTYGYGEDPTLASEMTVAFVQGLQGEDLRDGVACTGKHFLGYSQSESALNAHKSLATRRELREVFGKPFEAAIQKADIKCIMNCYSEVEGQPMCANKAILTDMLRDDMGFDGVVVSDYNSIRHVISDFHMADTMLEASKLALEAGLDVELPTRMGYNDDFTAAVENGDIDLALVDRSARRILKLKFELGLFENPFPRMELIPSAMDNTENNRYSLEAARKSITLMKNDGILPIRDTKKKLLVVGPTGDSIRLLIGHYTYVAMMEMLMLMMSGGKEVQPGVNPDDVKQDEESKGAFDDVAAKMSTSNLADKHLLDPMIRHRVQLRATNDGDFALHEVLMHICIGVCCTVCSDQQLRTVEEGSLSRQKFDLARPLFQARNGVSANLSRFLVLSNILLMQFHHSGSGAAASNVHLVHQLLRSFLLLCCFHCRLIIGRCFSFFKADCTGGAVWQAITETVTEVLPDQFSLPVELFFPLAERKVPWTSKKGDKGKFPLDPSQMWGA